MVNFQFNVLPNTPQSFIDGFNEAAELWRYFLNDNVTVVVDIGSDATLASNVIGSTGSNRLAFTYAQTRAALVMDSLSADDATAVANLPAGPALDVFINRTSDNPNGSGNATPYLDNDGGANNTTFFIPRANARALGLIPANDAGVDGSIVFNPAFSFDFDRADGISSGTTDFVAVAAHEIGHLLGFSSGVGVLDNNDGQNMRPGPFGDNTFDNISVLDLFRQSTNAISGGADLDFSADARVKFFTLDGGTTSLGTFSTGENNGDGRQPSHWKDGLSLGIMDPTFAKGEFGVIRPLDLRAFDVIGWNLITTHLLPSPVIDGTVAGDEYIVSQNPTDTTQVQIQLGGKVIATYTLTDLTALTINGLGGDDTLVIDRSNGNPIPAGGIVFNGGTGSDTLAGQNTINTWIITGAGSGTFNGGTGVAFSGVENLLGGTAADSFTFAGGSLAGSVDGGAGTDTIVGDGVGRTTTLTAVNAGTLAGLLGTGFTSVENHNGGAGNDTFTFAGGSLTGFINGGADSDTIVGDGAGRTFFITSPNAGSVSGLVDPFSSIENLTGGGGDDAFRFQGGSVDGTINGGAGFDSVFGDDVGRIYNISAPNSGNLPGLLGNFISIENLIAGNGDDIFRFFPTGSISGDLDGGGGIDNLDFSPLNTPQHLWLMGLGFTDGMNGFMPNKTLIGRHFYNFNLLTGSSADGDTLTGYATPSTWTINAANAGHYFTTRLNPPNLVISSDLDFASFENLHGSEGPDTFRFAGGSIGTIDGGGDMDTIVGDDVGRSFVLFGTDFGTITGLMNGAFTAVENLTGGAAPDAFFFSPGDRLTGRMDGGGGSDVLSVTGGAGADLITLQALAVDPETGAIRKTGLLGLNGLQSRYQGVEQIVLDGAAGADRFEIYFANGDPVPVNGVNVTGGSESDVLAVFGTVNADKLTLLQTAVQVNAAVITYGQVEQMDLFGGDGSDVFDARFVNYEASLALVRLLGEGGADKFTLTPSASTKFQLDGGPTLRGGLRDSLVFVNTGQIPVNPVPNLNLVRNGVFNFSNRKQVIFNNI